MSSKTFIPTVCPYCGAGCAFYVVVEDGRAVGLEYMAEHPVSEGALCPKGNAALEALNHPDRLTHPLVKRNGRFQEVGWEQALDFISHRLSAIRQSAGPDALGFLSSAKCSNEENYLFQKLARWLGTNNVDHCARLCHAPTVVGLAHTLGSAAMTNPIPDLINADCIFVIGSNFAENYAPVARWVWRARDRGARVIVADPRLTPTAWLADIFLQLRPGTDVALLNGMMHVILTEGLADRDFIAQRTTGFEALARHVAAYPPSRVAEITGVSPAQIVAAARAFASASAATLIYCMGITQHTTGSDNVLACADLALMCGQVGRPGAGLMPLRGQNNVQGACDMGALPDFLPGYQRVSNLRPQISNPQSAIRNPQSSGLTVVEMINAAYDGQIKAMVVMGENPILSDPNADHAREALSRLDLLVVQDIFMTETAELADVVLPAAAWAEKSGSYTTTERRVQWSPQAVQPPGEARADWQIVCDVARRIQGNLEELRGTQGGLVPPSSSEFLRVPQSSSDNPWDYASPVDVLAEINRTVPIYAGITPERLAAAPGGLFWPCPAPDHPGTPILHTERFATPDGRARLVPVDYVAPAEEPAGAFPLTLTTGRVVVHHNAGSMTRRSPSLLARAPALFVEVNPADAERLGLAEGDAVTVSTARGRAEAKVRITDTVETGVAFMPFHFEGTNRLTIDALDPRAKIPEYKVAACQVGPAKKEG
ncbi:MAG: molybdopterin-dependent oxidoreductase [Anaerolineae bacterium]|nr:molybdopterin-dependent oxidoreductase [Anaerolineae bacterium]